MIECLTTEIELLPETSQRGTKAFKAFNLAVEKAKRINSVYKMYFSKRVFYYYRRPRDPQVYADICYSSH